MEGSRPHAGRAQTHTRNTNHFRTQATQGKPRTHASHARTQITHTPWWDRWMYPKAAVTCLPGRSKQHLRARRPQNPSPRYRVKPPVMTAAPAAGLHHSRSSTYMMWSGIQSRSVSASVAPSDAAHAGIPVLGKAPGFRWPPTRQYCNLPCGWHEAQTSRNDPYQLRALIVFS